ELPAAGEQFRMALSIFESIAAADARSVDGRLGAALSHHNIGNVEARGGHRDAARRSYEAARRLYEPIVAGVREKAGGGGMPADSSYALARVQPPRPEELDAECRLYRLADAKYASLRAAGRLPADKADKAAAAAKAVAGCGGTPAS